jgi:hypothetical protein
LKAFPARIKKSSESTEAAEKLKSHLDFSVIANFYAREPVKLETAARQLGMSSAQLLETAGVKSRKLRSDVTLAKLGKTAQARCKKCSKLSAEFPYGRVAKNRRSPGIGLNQSRRLAAERRNPL